MCNCSVWFVLPDIVSTHHYKYYIIYRNMELLPHNVYICLTHTQNHNNTIPTRQSQSCEHQHATLGSIRRVLRLREVSPGKAAQQQRGTTEHLSYQFHKF